MIIFQYDPQILDRYPNLVGGVILARDVRNAESSRELREDFLGEQQATLARLGDAALSTVESLAAWRLAFRTFGVKPTKYRSACEALLRRLTKQGEIPTINALVDIANLVSIRYALPVAAFDIGALEGSVTVRFATGTERYTPLGQDAAEHPKPGEVIFSDDSDLVIARRWCWRQSAESAAQKDSRVVLITIEAHHEGGRSDVEAGLDDLRALLKQHTGGEIASMVLSSEQPQFDINLTQV